jgi:hypothetical protein
MAEERFLRFGEWAEKYAHNYFGTLVVWTPGTTYGYSAPVQLEQRTVDMLNKESFVRMLKDYDKHLDDGFVL